MQKEYKYLTKKYHKTPQGWEFSSSFYKTQKDCKIAVIEELNKENEEYRLREEKKEAERRDNEPDVIIMTQEWDTMSGHRISARVKENLAKTRAMPHPSLITDYWWSGKELFCPKIMDIVTNPKTCRDTLNQTVDPKDACVKYCEDNGLSYKFYAF